MVALAPFTPPEFVHVVETLARAGELVESRARLAAILGGAMLATLTALSVWKAGSALFARSSLASRAVALSLAAHALLGWGATRWSADACSETPAANASTTDDDEVATFALDLRAAIARPTSPSHVERTTAPSVVERERVPEESREVVEVEDLESASVAASDELELPPLASQSSDSLGVSAPAPAQHVAPAQRAVGPLAARPTTPTSATQPTTAAPSETVRPVPTTTDDSASRVLASTSAKPSSSNRPPNYPAKSKRRREEGTVVVVVELDAEGRVLTVELASSSGHAALDQAALEAVRGWTFEPARRAGLAIASRVEVPITFKLARE